MGLKIIGSGFGRTGTMSTKTALEQLGFGPCHHMIEVMRNPEQPAYWATLAAGQEVDWAEVFADYTVAYIIFQNQVDDRELMARYIPQAIKFIYASGGEVVVFEEESQIPEGPGDFPRTISGQAETDQAGTGQVGTGQSIAIALLSEILLETLIT